MTEELPRRTEKPWGFELLVALTPHYAGKLISVKQGHRLSLQYHEKKDETIYIHQGKVRLEVGADENSMTPVLAGAGQSVRIAPLTRHRLEALEDTLLFEVSTPDLGDVKRLADDYGRADR